MSSTNNDRLDFIIHTILDAHKKYISRPDYVLRDKSQFDLVTSVDFGIEEYIISQIRTRFPSDRILSEETNSATLIKGDTWTIDPIDGTYNMASGIRLFGTQCALYQQGEIVLSAIYLPLFNEMYYAQLGRGAFLNGEQIRIKQPDLQHCIVSCGDFPHGRTEDTQKQLKIMAHLTPRIAKIRMFGAACMDFTAVASGKTAGTVIFTKNKWDIAPGMLLCREAGALIKDTKGDYNNESAEVIVCATQELYQTIMDSLC